MGQSKALLINDVSIKGLDFSKIAGSEPLAINASSSSLADVRFDGLNMQGSNLDAVLADAVSFRDCSISFGTFRSSFLFECDMSGTNVEGADFHDLDPDSTIFISDTDGKLTLLSGDAAIGYLRYNSARTDPVDDIHIYRHHPKFPILKKICEKVSEQRNSQLRGLTQRGEARVDPPFARDLMARFMSLGWVTIDKNDLVAATPSGRPILQKVASGEFLPSEIVDYLTERK
jgi:uncharacterized protein YjbI with pentapeptide repeats